ncbi:P-loop containing nucleoside triphosphate hydrolase protein [Crassisporium funariophilum]|nr:P-loop containing nucleoside triphosphate hydrolase protein [Crassisporium funariophilum]
MCTLKCLAPTGSGKTVLFELCIIRALSSNGHTGQKVKCVYIAPTKALCSERFRDWAARFDPIGLKCCELTGDTVVFGNSAWGDAKNASIMCCEKWDSLTRNWHDHNEILSQIQLFLVDEVHILNESRGSTLEVVTSRMKLRGSDVRFILVSATVPNIDDIASWIGIGGGFGKSEPAKVFEFGDEYRPCRLTRHVVPVPRRNGTNDFQFAKVLDYKLFSTVQQYSVGKPTLVFCSTRKGMDEWISCVFGTAEQLMKEYSETEAKKESLPWSRPAKSVLARHPIRDLAAFGIGVHHAGLSMDDRRATENLYLKLIIRVLVATSTLAVGVNLPAHMVVIKGVRIFQNNTSMEYSDLDILQMLGRAGRPQFDTDGLAIIMCESELEQKYKTMAQGKTILESSLHVNLAEHLNSEIGLGTITDVESATAWLRSSFLYQRMRKNPRHYSLEVDGLPITQTSVDDVVLHSIAQLEQTQLIHHTEHGDGAGKLTSTEYGEIMSKFYIRRETMRLILALPEHATLRDMVGTVYAFVAPRCQTTSIGENCKSQPPNARTGQISPESFHLNYLSKIFNKLRKDIDIRYEVKKVDKTCDKVFLLIQAVLGGVSLNAPEYKSGDSQPYMEAFTVFKHVARIARAVVEVAISKKHGAQVKYGLELFRCLTAKAWEDRAIVLRQIEQIGEKSIKVLAEHGITSLDILRKQNPLRVETLLNRRSPFGLEVLASVAELPQYSLNVKELEVHSDGGKSPVCIDVLVECGLKETLNPSKPKKHRHRSINMTAILTLTSDLDFIDFRRIPTKALKGGKSFELTAQLRKPSQSIVVFITSENIAGVTLQQVIKPKVASSEYPVMDTRPLSSIDQDLAGLDEDPDFWNMTIDSGSPLGSPLIENSKATGIRSTSLLSW